MAGGGRLLIETSGRGGTVGLAVGGAIFTRQLDAAARHNRDLARLTRELLTEAAVAPDQVTEVAVSVGPGSYTGLRVGVVSAKAFCYATGAGLLAVPTFAAVAHDSPPEWDSVEVIADGLQGLVYREGFARTPAGWRSTRPLGLTRIDDWLTERDPAVPVAGPGVKLLAARLPGGTPHTPPAGPTLAALDAAAGHVTPLGRANLMGFEPVYLRASSAELQWARFKKS